MEERPTLEPIRTGERQVRHPRLAVGLTIIGAALVVAVFQLGTMLRSGSAVPPEPLPARIAVVGPDGAFSTIDDRGHSQVPHPVDGVGFQFPAWSPDGLHVAAIGSSADGGGVYVFRTRSGPQDPTNVPRPTAIYESAESPPFYLYWSPDGRQIAFLTQESAGLSLRVAPVDGSAPATIIRQGAPLYWDWLEPGRALVNASAGGPDAFLGAIGVDGAAGDATATAGIFRSPAVSRDGRHRAYVALTGPGSEAIVIESEGSGRHEIPVTGMTAFAFDPAGRSLAWIDPSADTGAVGFPIGPIQVIDLETGEERRLAEGNFIAFFWSPDGRTIAGLRLPEPTDEDVATLAARPVRPAVTLAAVSGYSLRLAFLDVATAEIRSTSGVRVSPLFGLQVLPFFDQYALSHHFWAPDGSSIALPLVAEDDTVGIVVLPADGSEPRRVAEGEMGFWSP